MQKEKLVRVALMALKNLITVGPMSLEYAVVEKGLPKAVSNRSLQVPFCWRRRFAAACCRP